MRPGMVLRALGLSWAARICWLMSHAMLTPVGASWFRVQGAVYAMRAMTLRMRVFGERSEEAKAKMEELSRALEGR